MNPDMENQVRSSNFPVERQLKTKKIVRISEHHPQKPSPTPTPFRPVAGFVRAKPRAYDRLPSIVAVERVRQKFSADFSLQLSQIGLVLQPLPYGGDVHYRVR